MKHARTIAFSLLLCALAMGLGLILNHPVYWLVVDIAVIVICTLAGISLLLRAKQKPEA